jgi:hypothetical protein
VTQRARPDFSKLISEAITGNLREHLRHLLLSYEHNEFGAARTLRTDEISLILSVFDHLATEFAFNELGVAEFTDLIERLCEFADDETLTSPDQLRLRNACFDAVACIRALQSRLVGLMRANAVYCERLGEQQSEQSASSG